MAAGKHSWLLAAGLRLSVVGLLAGWLTGCEPREAMPEKAGRDSGVVTDGARVAAAEEVPPVRVVSWNVREVFNDADRAARAGDFRQFGNDLKPDVLVLQEITDPAVVKQMLGDMGLGGYYLAMSNFRQGDTTGHDDFEVAIASRWPLSGVVEFDPSPDNEPGDTPEKKLVAPPLEGLKTPMTARGFLTARIDAVKLVVIGTHLKSSSGRVGMEDWKNSQQREFIAAAMAAEVSRARKADDTVTVIVAGDFNVAAADKRKVGSSLVVDNPADPAASDGYDETHALVGGGLVSGLRMINLADGIRRSSYPSYPSPSPIDVIYVSGPGEGAFSPAVLGNTTYGSDHLPILTVMKR